MTNPSGDKDGEESALNEWVNAEQWKPLGHWTDAVTGFRAGYRAPRSSYTPATGLDLWGAVSPDNKLIAAPFDTEQQVRDWAKMSIDEKYRPYRPVRFVAVGAPLPESAPSRAEDQDFSIFAEANALTEQAVSEGSTPKRIEPQYISGSVSGEWVKEWQDHADQLERELADEVRTVRAIQSELDRVNASSSVSTPTHDVEGITLSPEVMEAIDAYGRYYAAHHKLGMSIRDDMKYVASVAIRFAARPSTPPQFEAVAYMHKGNAMFEPGMKPVDDALLYVARSSTTDTERGMVAVPVEFIDTAKAIAEAVRWVLRDAAFKAPEEVGDIAQRWIDRLRGAEEVAQEKLLASSATRENSE